MSPAAILLTMIFITGVLVGSWATFAFVHWRLSKIVVRIQMGDEEPT